MVLTFLDLKCLQKNDVWELFKLYKPVEAQPVYRLVVHGVPCVLEQQVVIKGSFKVFFFLLEYKTPFQEKGILLSKLSERMRKWRIFVETELECITV